MPESSSTPSITSEFLEVAPERIFFKALWVILRHSQDWEPQLELHYNSYGRVLNKMVPSSTPSEGT